MMAGTLVNKDSGVIQTRRRLCRLYFQRFKAGGLTRTARLLLKPRLAGFHLKRIIFGSNEKLSNFYVPSGSRTEEVEFCNQLLGTQSALELFDELDQDRAFVNELNERYKQLRPETPFNIGRFATWYTIVRLLAPRTVVETGVHDGLSSAVILRAMSRNNCGTLISIDLPSYDLPVQVEGCGWLVPPALKTRWRLHVGDARRLLPGIAKESSPIDIFIHDSDHTATFQRFEYQTVQPYLSEEGILLTDDAIPGLFTQLAKQWGTNAIFASGSVLENRIVLGGMRLRGETRRAVLLK